MVGALVILCGYLVGSLSAAILVCRALGFPDPRTVGSNNPGATNVLRSAGKLAAALALTGDVAKGLLPVLAAWQLQSHFSVVAATGVAAFLGHLYPVFFGFKGGKGVATQIGVLAGFSPLLGLLFCGVWVGVAAASRYSSLAALTATVAMPVLALVIGLPIAIATATVFMAALVLWRHRDNIARLRNGTESRIGTRK